MAPDVTIAAARIEKAARAGDSTAADAALGVARLLLGRVDDAVDILEDVVSKQPRRAAFQNDLASAYLTRAVRTDRADDYPKALAAAERALTADPNLLEGLFNRGLILESLQLKSEARKTWSQYLALDPESAWSAEARTRIAGLSSRTAHAWSEARADNARLLEAATASTGLPRALRQSVRERAEDQWLPEWGRMWQAGDEPGARAQLGRIAQLTSSLVSADGDRMPAAAVKAIEAALANGERAKVDALAEAHVLFGNARALFLADRISDAAEVFRAAEAPFSAGGSPYALWSHFYGGVSDYANGRTDRAAVVFDDLLNDKRTPNYAFLSGRAYWLAGSVHLVRGAIDRAVVRYNEALSAFEATGEVESEAALETLLGETLFRLGDLGACWQRQLAALQKLEEIPPGSRRHMILLNGGFFALWQDYPEAALHFQEALVEEDERAGMRADLTEAYVHRARIRLRLSRVAAAAEDLSRADSLLQSVSELGLRNRYAAEIDVVRVELSRHTLAPDAAIASATAALEYFKNGAHGFREVQLLMLRAQAEIDAKRHDLAERDLAVAIGLFEKQRSAWSDPQYRLTSFTEGWDAYNEMIRLKALVQNTPDAALDFVEDSRGRALLESIAGSHDALPSPTLDLRRRLPPQLVVVYYVSLTDRTLIWTLSRSQSRFVESHVTRAWLEDEVGRFRRLVERGASIGSVKAASRSLYDSLIGPVVADWPAESTVVIVADAPLSDLPFVCLTGADGRMILDDYTLASAPSLSVFLQTVAERDARRDVPTTIAVAGNPTVSKTFDAAPLVGAEREAADIASLYPQADVLLREKATPANFLEAAARADVVHFAGHTMVNRQYPLLSRLAMAASAADPGSLFAYEIATHRFRRPSVVVLASCDSGAGPAVKGEGVLSLARPFLASGIPLVVATLWTIEDESARDFFQRFHVELAKGVDPARALRAVQTQLANDTTKNTSLPINWAGVIAIGAARAERRTR